MRVSSTEEYGLRCLIQVAQHDANGPLPIQEIAGSEGISPEYAAKLLRLLRQGGLVQSTRGANGGYELTRPAGEISVLQAIEALDGALMPDDWCQKHSGQLLACAHGTGCNVQGLWQYIANLLGASLSQISIEDVTTGRMAMMTRLHQAPGAK